MINQNIRHSGRPDRRLISTPLLGLALRVLAAVVLGAASLSAVAAEEVFPSKPIKLVVSTPPGGSTDISARLIAVHLERRLGQPVVVENRAGANNTLAPKFVAASRPDGYTLYYGTATAPHPLFVKNNSVDALKQLAPVSVTQSAPLIWLVRSSLGINSFQELVDYSKKNPERLNYASNSVVTFDMLMQVLNQRTGLSYTTIPYKGVAQIMPEMISGRVDLMVTNTAGMLPYVQDGTLRPLFVTKRSSSFPKVPTAAEVGLSHFEAGSNFGIWAPYGTPAEVLAKLSSAVQQVVKSPEVSAEIRKAGGEPVGSTPQETSATQESDIRFWGEVARATNFSPQ